MSTEEGTPPLILVCDDDPDARNLIVASLSPLGYETVEAGDGQEAMEAVRSRLPDAIILDIMMPRVTGLEFLSWFRDAFPEPFVPVLLLTALDQIESRVEGFSKGADDYLTKPFHFKELQARVQASLRVRDLMEKLRKQARELSEAQEKLIEQEKQITAVQLGATTAHNFGQPVQAMLLNLFLLERAVKASPEEIPEIVQQLKTHCQTVKDLLGKIQEVSARETSEYVGGIKLLQLRDEK